jgi:hypothetical protein
MAARQAFAALCVLGDSERSVEEPRKPEEEDGEEDCCCTAVVVFVADVVEQSQHSLVRVLTRDLSPSEGIPSDSTRLYSVGNSTANDSQSRMCLNERFLRASASLHDSGLVRFRRLTSPVAPAAAAVGTVRNFCGANTTLRSIPFCLRSSRKLRSGRE